MKTFANWYPFATMPKEGDFLIHFASGYISRGRLINGTHLAVDSMGPVNRTTDTTPLHWAEIPEPPQQQE